MAHELELAAGDAVGGFKRFGSNHMPPMGTPCANCGERLRGPWCYACGQSGEDFHRSIGRLIGEVIEGLLHVDGRLWRTLPDLILRPARLTSSYLDGHRAPQIPPLRLFLVVLLAIFLVGGITGSSKLLHINTSTTSTDAATKVITHSANKKSGTLSDLTPEQRMKLGESLKDMKVNIGSDKPNADATKWLQERLARTLADPERFQLIMEQWSERFAFLMLPISALLLSIVFIFQRRFYLFDHTIFSLHSLSAMGLVLTVSMALAPFTADYSYLLMAPAPAHLFVHLRGVYKTSIIGTLIRMLLLFNGTVFAATLLIIGLIAVGLNGMGD